VGCAAASHEPLPMGRARPSAEPAPHRRCACRAAARMRTGATRSSAGPGAATAPRCS